MRDSAELRPDGLHREFENDDTKRPAASAMMDPGILGAHFGIARISARDAIASPVAIQSTVRMWLASAWRRAKNSLGFSGILRPRKSLICVDAINRAIPLVKPIMIGLGM